MNKIIEDKELGRLIVQINPRAKHLIFRPKSDAIYITVPPGTHVKEIEDGINKLKSKLLHAREKCLKPPINLDYHIETEFFKLSLILGSYENFLAHSELGNMKIICPPTADFKDEKLQLWLRKVIEEALRRNAKAILPQRLYLLSNQHNLPFTDVKINSSRGRWGSCSARKSINLSYFLVLLPQHLIDYVLLHELCHTREMNHSEDFWILLNSVTNNKAFAYRNELKGHKTDI